MGEEIKELNLTALGDNQMLSLWDLPEARLSYQNPLGYIYSIFLLFYIKSLY